MAEAELCVSTSRPLPKPKSAGSRHSTPESEKYKKTVPLVLTLTHPALSLNLSTLFPFIRKFLVHLPFCHSLYPSLPPPSASLLLPLLGPGPVCLNCSLYRFSHCFQTSSFDCSRAYHCVTCLILFFFFFWRNLSSTRSGTCSPHKRFTNSVALLRPNPTCWVSAPS